MPEPSAFGVFLRKLRRERGFTQEALAERAEVSKDTIAKLEQGRRYGARTSTLIALATALDVDLAQLVGKRERLGEDRDGGSIRALRAAVLSASLLPGLPGLDADDDGGATPLPALNTAVAGAWSAYWRGDFGRLTATVPGLVSEARITRRSVGAAAAGALAQAYQLAACLLVHLGKDDLAAISAERGIAAAAEGDDQWQWATVQGTYAWILHHQARLDEAEELAVRVAGMIEPSFSASAPHLSAWGNLLMAALAPCAASRRDPAEYVSMAAAAAERLGGRVSAYQTAFGPATVAMQTVHAYTVLREPGKALMAARKINPGDLKGISYGRHLLDVAQAQTDARHRRAATATLCEARDVSPLWFRHQGVARGLVEELRELETRPSREIASLAKTLDVAR